MAPVVPTQSNLRLFQPFSPCFSSFPPLLQDPLGATAAWAPRARTAKRVRTSSAPSPSAYLTCRFQTFRALAHNNPPPSLPPAPHPSFPPSPPRPPRRARQGRQWQGGPPGYRWSPRRQRQDRRHRTPRAKRTRRRDGAYWLHGPQWQARRARQGGADRGQRAAGTAWASRRAGSRGQERPPRPEGRFGTRRSCGTHGSTGNGGTQRHEWPPGRRWACWEGWDSGDEGGSWSEG